MKSDAPPEWHRLFNAALNDQLSDAECERLATVLKSSTEARQLWFLYQDNECSLAELKPRHQAKSLRTGLPWLSWRTLTAAAAGLMIGLFSASMVYGFISQRAAGRVVPLVVMNAGFESGNGPLKPGYSRRVAEWTGSGVLAGTPDGRRCARLAPVLPLNVKSRAGVLLQTVDMETMGALEVPEGARLVISAEINASSLPTPGMRHFALRVLTFSQTAQEVLATIWPDQQEAAEVNVVRTLEVDGDAQSWQRLRTRLELPKGTRSVMIQISGPRTPPGTEVESLPEFWVDSVQAHLELPREDLP